jgi:DNA phosphorothioation-dependent restriction protein DptG
MMSIINLEALANEISNSNPTSTYMPVRTNYNSCDWDAVSGLFIGSALGLELKNYNLETFESDCELAFKEKLNEESFWSVLKKTYFDERDIFKVALPCMLLKASKEEAKPANQRIANVLKSLLNNEPVSFNTGYQLNFIEQIFVDTLKGHLKNSQSLKTDQPYLPFLSKNFQQDIKFLANHPKYLIEELPNFLALYIFLYTSQLALNLPEWRKGTPKSKPLYFILDTEKASSERTKIKDSGWESFTDAAHAIFPFLSMLEVMQLPNTPKKPLWTIASELNECGDDSHYKEAIKDYALRFQINRGINKNLPPANSALEWLENLLELSHNQFDKKFADPTSTRYQANQKVVSGIVEYIAEGFVQNRRRGGNVLVLNQDNLLLLTNITIGNCDQLRLAELIEGFENRGVYFDKQTQQRVVDFYERIGNVERMSDSGEAVYVRKTI